MKRILVFSVSAGLGHIRAAQAIQAEANENFKDKVIVENYDALDFVTKTFKAMYSKSYTFLVNHAPSLWGLVYREMEKDVERKTLVKLVDAYDKISYKKLVRFIRNFRADFILATHFLPANVVVQRRISCPLGVIITDYDVHKFWVNKGVWRYFVATPEVKWQLVQYGVPEEKIVVTGIPINPVFTIDKDKDGLMEKFGLRKDKRVLLLMSSGIGMDLIGALKKLLEIKLDFQMLVVVGNEKRIYKKCLSIIKDLKQDRIKIFGYVSNIEEFMSVSDLVITKAGGLSITECLAKSRPMIILSPIQGQEERNCDYLLENNCAVKAKNIEMLGFKVVELLNNEEKIKSMSKNMEKITRPFAARQVLEYLHKNW